MYEYKATLDRVVDGDTVDLNIDLGFDVWIKKRVRLHHVDTPEKRTSNPLEKHFGFMSTGFVIRKLTAATEMVITTTIDGPTDKYGRVLGVIWLDKELLSINDQLIEKRYAVQYEGQNKSLIDSAHINNYKYLVENGETKLSEELQILYNQLP